MLSFSCLYSHRRWPQRLLWLDPNATRWEPSGHPRWVFNVALSCPALSARAAADCSNPFAMYSSANTRAAASPIPFITTFIDSLVPPSDTSTSATYGASTSAKNASKTLCGTVSSINTGHQVAVTLHQGFLALQSHALNWRTLCSPTCVEMCSPQFYDGTS
jgi:hypothetical protein